MEKLGYTPLEAQAQDEAESKPQFDAALVHCYWISRNPDNTFRNSLRTRLATRAIALAYDDGKGFGKIVIPGGHIKGPSYPSTAELMKDELIHKYGIPEDVIIAIPEGYGTEEEAQIFLGLAKEKGWSSVVDVAFHTHYKSISRFIPEGNYPGLQITYQPVEGIIRERDNHHVVHLVDRLTHSRYEYGFIAYEFAKDIAIRIPGVKDKMYSANRAIRSTKDNSKFNDITQHVLDIFKS